MFCCSPYGFLYDGLLLAIPGLVWFLRPETYGTARRHFWCGVAIAAAYVFQEVSGWIQRGPALTGLAIVAWLVADAIDFLLRGRATLADRAVQRTEAVQSIAVAAR